MGGKRGREEGNLGLACFFFFSPLTLCDPPLKTPAVVNKARKRKTNQFKHFAIDHKGRERSMLVPFASRCHSFHRLSFSSFGLETASSLLPPSCWHLLSCLIYLFLV